MHLLVCFFCSSYCIQLPTRRRDPSLGRSVQTFKFLCLRMPVVYVEQSREFFCCCCWYCVRAIIRYSLRTLYFELLSVKCVAEKYSVWLSCVVYISSYTWATCVIWYYAGAYSGGGRKLNVLTAYIAIKTMLITAEKKLRLQAAHHMLSLSLLRRCYGFQQGECLYHG